MGICQQLSRSFMQGVHPNCIVHNLRNLEHHGNKLKLLICYVLGVCNCYTGLVMTCVKTSSNKQWTKQAYSDSLHVCIHCMLYIPCIAKSFGVVLGV